MITTDSVDLFSPATRQATRGGLAGAGTGGEGGFRDVGTGDDARDPRRHPAAAADGAADRFQMGVAEPGRIVMELDPDESLENTIGLLHGATAAALLDTAMGCAISTMLAGRADLGHARSEADLSAAVVGQVGHHRGGRKAGQARPPDQLCRRLRPRRRRRSCSARDRDIYDAGGANREIDAAFRARDCYYMIADM